MSVTAPPPPSVEIDDGVIREARRRQRRRRAAGGAVAVVVLLGLAVARSVGGGGDRSSRPPVAASPADIRAFLAQAKRGMEGAYTLTYAVGARYSDGTVRHIVVTAWQRSSTLFSYRETPSLNLSRPGGPSASQSYEVFAGYPRLPNAPAGLYSCARRTERVGWSCTAYPEIGMGATGELVGPYPPQALVLGLDNAAETYTGRSPSPAIRSERAFLFRRRLGGQTLRCLGFGPSRHRVGRVCLEPDGVIVSYELPQAVTYSAYETATLRAYSPDVASTSFVLPAKVTVASGGAKGR